MDVVFPTTLIQFYSKRFSRLLKVCLIRRRPTQTCHYSHNESRSMYLGFPKIPLQFRIPRRCRVTSRLQATRTPCYLAFSQIVPLLKYSSWHRFLAKNLCNGWGGLLRILISDSHPYLMLFRRANALLLQPLDDLPR